MLKIKVDGFEIYDENSNRFIETPATYLKLEHSLISVSKWEAKYHKSFLHTESKTEEELLYYIKCMTLNDVPDEVYLGLSKENVQVINSYIDDSMTATTFNEQKKPHKNKIITAEIIYYWMIAQNIPPQFEKWHLNRLLTLIKVCSIMNEEPKKMTKKQTAQHYAQLNKARRKARR